MVAIVLQRRRVVQFDDRCDARQITAAEHDGSSRNNQYPIERSRYSRLGSRNRPIAGSEPRTFSSTGRRSRRNRLERGQCRPAGGGPRARNSGCLRRQRLQRDLRRPEPERRALRRRRAGAPAAGGLVGRAVSCRHRTLRGRHGPVPPRHRVVRHHRDREPAPSARGQPHLRRRGVNPAGRGGDGLRVHRPWVPGVRGGGLLCGRVAGACRCDQDAGAVRGDRVGRSGHRPDLPGFGRAARVGVLDDHAGRRALGIEFGDAFVGRVGVVDVVVG